MKAWLGVVGRACIEFVIILILISFTAGASSSIVASNGGARVVAINACKAALDLVPLAALLTLFLAFFPFERRIKSRAAGWLGLVVLGFMLFSFGIGIRRAPLLRELASASEGTKQELRLQAAGTMNQSGRSVLWVGSYEGGEAADVVDVDFGSDYPRLVYASRAPLDVSNGAVDIQGRICSAALPNAKPLALFPEASVYEGSWFWDRLAAMDGASLLFVFASIGGFILLAVGCRFLCRITLWPLANAIIAAAALVALVALDATLSGPDMLGFISSLAGRCGLVLPEGLLLAALEALIGLALSVIDFVLAPKRRGGLDA
jgi:hypothetical protein